MTVSDQVIQVLNKVCEKIGIAVDWSQENVVPYLQELCTKYVRYEIVWSIVTLVTLAVLTMLFCKFAIVRHKAALKVEYDPFEFDSVIAIIGWVVVGIMCLVDLIVGLCAVKTIVTGITFPEKLVFDYATSLLSGS